jgi:hypothetical protein
LVIAPGWLRAARLFLEQKKTGPNSEVKTLRLLRPDISHGDSLSNFTGKEGQISCGVAAMPE